MKKLTKVQQLEHDLAHAEAKIRQSELSCRSLESQVDTMKGELAAVKRSLLLTTEAIAWLVKPKW